MGAGACKLILNRTTVYEQYYYKVLINGIHCQPFRDILSNIHYDKYQPRK